MADEASYPSCFDPYLRYAISTDFADFEFFREGEDFKLFFMVEFKSVDAVMDFTNAMGDRFKVELGPVAAHERTRYRTLRAIKSAVTEQSALDLWIEYVERVELSLPLKSHRSGITNLAGIIEQRWNEGQEPTGELLIGLLDDGCPFAARQFLRHLAPPSTRVRAIWDQNQDKPQGHVLDGGGNPCVFGQDLPDFNYGLEYWRDFAVPPTGSPRLIGIDEWIGLHLAPAGTIDEDHAYADAFFKSLAPRESHGAHVLDVLAGRLPP